MTTERPNVLFIMADQFRYDFMGCAGASFIDTPNLDRLASRGTRLTHCVTTSPICAPARISLATGLLPSRVGALDNAAFLPARVPTYYQQFRDHGYHVGCVGKLDLAKPDHYNGLCGDRPRAFGWGFTHPIECEGKMHAGNSAAPVGPYTNYLHGRGLLQRFHDDYQDRKKRGWTDGATEDSVLPADAFEDSYIGRTAVEWIGARSIERGEGRSTEFPWHLFVSFVGPHDPYDPPTEYADRYRDKPMRPPIPADDGGKPEWIKRRARTSTDEEVAVSRRQYCAATELIDDQIGAMMDALERQGLSDNTYVVFSSDHGEMLGDHGLYTKHCAYEASMRVPLIVSGPGIGRGETSGRWWNCRTSTRRCASLPECLGWTESTRGASPTCCTAAATSTEPRS